MAVGGLFLIAESRGELEQLGLYWTERDIVGLAFGSMGYLGWVAEGIAGIGLLRRRSWGRLLSILLWTGYIARQASIVLVLSRGTRVTTAVCELLLFRGLWLDLPFFDHAIPIPGAIPVVGAWLLMQPSIKAEFRRHV
jgi:hypothetical protein